MLVQDTLSLEGTSPCHFLAMCEDANAHAKAMEICGGIMGRFGDELAFAFSFWKFKDLKDPASAHWAVEAVARADILLLSLTGRDLTLEANRWLDACVQVRTKAGGALALMVAQASGAGLAMEALLSRLELAAYQLRMDFLPLLPLPIGKPAAWSSALLSQGREESGSTHWGLNE